VPDLGCEQDGESIPSHFCDYLKCVQAGVKSCTVMKKKGIFHVLVRMNSKDVLPQFSYSFLVLLMMCSEVEAGNLTTLVHISLYAGKSMLKMKKTLWKNSLTAKDV
jgi:hypothetical protein